MSLLESDVKIDDYWYQQFKEPKDQKKYNDFISEEVFDYLWGMEISLNDTFGYAVGDCEYIYSDDWDDLDPLVQDFGHDAIRAYFALMLDDDVIKPLQTDDYFKCKKIIRTLKDEHGLFSWFEYGSSHSYEQYYNRVNAKKRKKLLEKVVDAVKPYDRNKELQELVKEIKEHLSDD